LGEQRIYRDAGITKESTRSDTISYLNTDLIIGEARNLARDFDGRIGEVRLYNRALTPLEIENNYLATKWRYN